MAENDLTIEIKQQGKITILVLNGKLDASTAAKVNTAFSEVLAKKQFDIIVEMSKCNYISSAGIGTFLANYKKIKAGKGNLVLSSLTADVKDVFDLLKFTALFQITHSQKDALARF